MDIGSIFLILAIFIPVVIYIARPLLERSSPTQNLTNLELSMLLAKRDQLVATLQELDDDHNLGKIPSDIYPSQRLTLLHSGADILRQIDTLQKSSTSVAAEDRLEAAIIARRATFDSASTPIRKNGNAVPPVPDDTLEQKIASRRRLKEGKAGGFCPKCGKPIQAIDRFCPRCGATLF